MRGIFRRNRKHEEELLAPLASADVSTLLPRSARQPEKQRFVPLATDLPDMDEEEDDEDIEFLESLAKSVDRQAPAPPRPAPVPRKEQPDEEALRIFHAMQRTRDALDRPEVNAHVPPVELDDLLEELSMTAAALRRKAA